MSYVLRDENKLKNARCSIPRMHIILLLSCSHDLCLCRLRTQGDINKFHLNS